MKTTTRNSEIRLSARDVTGSPNGYPEPYIGKFYFGFDNLYQAKEYADETGGYVRIAEWKDGWNNCILGGTPYEEFHPSSDNYGDNYQVIDTLEELRSDAYSIYYSLLQTSEEVSAMDHDEKEEYEDEINAAKERGYDLISECADIDWEKYSVILHCGDFYEKVPKKSMVFNWDTRTLVIGVVIFSDQD